MSALAKYTLARLGMFVATAAVILVLPIPLDIYLRLAIAVLVSAAVSYVMLKNLREQVATQLAGAAQKRADRKEKLREALAGEEDPTHTP